MSEFELLRARIEALEAQAEIARRMAEYGPAVDSGSADVAAALWADDGVYDSGLGVFRGADGVAEMVATDPHQGYVRSGCAHIVNAPHIVVDGDRAVAVTHSQLMLWDADAGAYRVWRVTANRWDWVRDESGWRVVSRMNRPLDGSEDARALFREAIGR